MILVSCDWRAALSHQNGNCSIPASDFYTGAFWGKCQICSHGLPSSCPLRAVKKPQCMWRCSTVKQPWHSNKHIAFCFILSWGSPGLKSFLHDCCWPCFLPSDYLTEERCPRSWWDLENLDSPVLWLGLSSMTFVKTLPPPTASVWHW